MGEMTQIRATIAKIYDYQASESLPMRQEFTLTKLGLSLDYPATFPSPNSSILSRISGFAATFLIVTSHLSWTLG